LSFTVPSQWPNNCAPASADIAIILAIEYQRIDRFGDPARHGHWLKEASAQPADHCQEPIEQVKGFVLDAVRAAPDADAHPVREKVEDRAAVL